MPRCGRRCATAASRARSRTSSSSSRPTRNSIAKTPDELLGVSAYVAKRTDNVIGNYFGASAAPAVRDHPGPRRARPFLHLGPRRARELHDEHLQSADAPALQHPRADAPRMRARAQLPGRAFDRAEDAAARSARTSISPAMARAGACIREWLGNEMGIYRTPYEKFGAAELCDVARGAAGDRHRHPPLRLVAPTGDRLSRFAHRACRSHEVETEVDRYISWPGQALSYKLGELTIRKLRAEAEASSGPGSTFAPSTTPSSPWARCR